MLRPHSVRKFFRVQLAALGVNVDCIVYMMGHKVNIYHDVKMLGLERLRQVYARSELSTRRKPPGDKLEMLKAFRLGAVLILVSATRVGTQPGSLGSG